MNAVVAHGDFAAALQAPGREPPSGIAADRGRSVERRFAVHRNNFVVSLIDALAESFPVTRALVGAEFFRAMARERILADPPRTPLLTEYAQAFPGYIAAFPPAASVPYLADVARIEAARIHVHHAADAHPLPAAAYQALLADPGRLSTTGMALHPACTWFESAHAAYSIWQAHQGLADMASAQLAQVRLDHPEAVLVARPGLEVHVCALPAGATALLDALARGQALGSAFGRAHRHCASVDDGALFALLVRYGLATGFTSATGEST
jgi:hypothetical protein